MMHKTQYRKHTKYMETVGRNLVKETAESFQLSQEDCPHQMLPCNEYILYCNLQCKYSQKSFCPGKLKDNGRYDCGIYFKG